MYLEEQKINTTLQAGDILATEKLGKTWMLAAFREKQCLRWKKTGKNDLFFSSEVGVRSAIFALSNGLNLQCREISCKDNEVVWELY